MTYEEVKTLLELNEKFHKRCDYIITRLKGIPGIDKLRQFENIEFAKPSTCIFKENEETKINYDFGDERTSNFHDFPIELLYCTDENFMFYVKQLETRIQNELKKNEKASLIDIAM